MVLAWVRKLFQTNRNPKARPTVVPRLEGLEERWAPAANTLHWIGPIGGNWSLAGNWLENTAPVAGNGDTLIFDNTQNTNSTDDIANLTIANLTVTNAYTSTITLNQTLEVDGNIDLEAGTIAAATGQQLNIPKAGSTFTWGGGTIDSTLTVNLGGVGANPTLLLNNQNNGVTLNGTFNSWANATMTCNGDVTMGQRANFNNRVGGNFTATFNIEVDHGFVGVQGNQATISNNGIFEKTVTTGTSTISVAGFTNGNGGTLLAASGTLAITGIFIQTGGTTNLAGGNISSSGTFAMVSGYLAGGLQSHNFFPAMRSIACSTTQPKASARARRGRSSSGSAVARSTVTTALSSTAKPSATPGCLL
jgi:hypothetical protein